MVKNRRGRFGSDDDSPVLDSDVASEPATDEPAAPESSPETEPPPAQADAETPKPKGTPVSLDVFAATFGQKRWDQVAGFKRWAKNNGLKRLTMAQWREKHAEFNARPIR